MIPAHISAFLALFSTTAAFPTRQWFTQMVWDIDLNPFMKQAALSIPPISLPENHPSSSTAASPVSLLYQFKERTVLENLAARSNGDLLLTADSHPVVYYFSLHNKRLSVLHTFQDTTSTLGIVEASPDVFIVAVGNYSGYYGEAGSFSVWSLDLTQNPKKPIATKITSIPQADALNGLTMLEGSTEIALISDSSLGAIWRVNLTSGAYDLAMRHVLFTNCTSKFPLGINGISAYEGKIYFVNSAQRLYGRVSVDAFGSATAEPEIITHSMPSVLAWDDLAMDWEGNSWIATHADAVTEVTIGGKQRNFTASGATPRMLQPTSIIFGRGSHAAEKTLYVVTGGEIAPGQVFAVDTRLI